MKPMNGTKQNSFYQSSVAEALKQMGSSSKGLTPSEAKYRLEHDGKSTILQEKKPKSGRLLASDRFTQVLLAGCVISFLIKDYSIGLLILATLSLHFLALISLKKQHYLFISKIKSHFSKNVLVVRSGKRQKISATDIVSGDVMILESGLKTSVDTRLISADNLVVDEHNLTGVDQPTRKSVAKIAAGAPLGQHKNLVYAGSIVLGGSGLGLVVANSQNSLISGRAMALTTSILPVATKYLTGQKFKKIYTVVLVLGLMGLSIAALSVRLETRTFWTLTVLVLVSSVPASLTIQLFSLARSKVSIEWQRQIIIQYVLRSNLANNLTLVFLTIGGAISVICFHVPAPIVTQQLIVLEMLILLLPTLALSWDVQPEKLRQPQISKHHLKEMLGVNLLASIIVIANFLLFFVRHHLAISYMNPQTYLYAQATTLSMLTFALCQWINMLFLRADEHKTVFSSFLFKNLQFYLMSLGSLIVLGFIIYTPKLETFFGTYSLGLSDWLLALAMVAIYGLLRLAQRHTRKHTRHAIIELHHELGFDHLIKKMSL